MDNVNLPTVEEQIKYIVDYRDHLLEECIAAEELDDTDMVQSYAKEITMVSAILKSLNKFQEVSNG
jgi:hypothetical protein